MTDNNHNTNLDKQGKVHVHFDDEVPFDGSCCVYIDNDWDGGIGLTALEALALLEWLMEEKPRLDAKAKEETE